MKIVIASGKGGTGKTTLSVNLAAALAGEGPVGLLDCDVEEPNCHLFLKPSFELSRSITVNVPAIDANDCTACGLCARACEFNALLALPGVPLFLPELCHSCGVCVYVCHEQAICEHPREIGKAGEGTVDGIHFGWGRLNVGEARSTPAVRAVKALADTWTLETIIIDAPPGVACPAIETLRGADFAVLVTEPTPFGLHDLVLAVQAARELGIPCGVVINRAGIGDNRITDFCRGEGIPVLLEIPDDRKIAEACSRGEVFSAQHEAFAAQLRTFAADLETRMNNMGTNEVCPSTSREESRWMEVAAT